MPKNYVAAGGGLGGGALEHHPLARDPMGSTVYHPRTGGYYKLDNPSHNLTRGKYKGITASVLVASQYGHLPEVQYLVTANFCGAAPLYIWSSPTPWCST